jgi:hypothetical protein
MPMLLLLLLLQRLMYACKAADVLFHQQIAFLIANKLRLTRSWLLVKGCDCGRQESANKAKESIVIGLWIDVPLC